jgi:hypothetical protein
MDVPAALDSNDALPALYYQTDPLPDAATEIAAIKQLARSFRARLMSLLI